VDRFDAARGVDFASYANPPIVGEVKRHFRDTTWVVHVPRRLQELKLQLPPITEELLQALHRAPTTAELAGRLGVSERDIVSAQRCANAYRPMTIERASSGRRDLRPDDWLGGPDPDLEAVANHHALRELLGRLPARERRILAMRFEADMSQTQIATEVGLSQMHVSRLLAKCLAQLHEGLVTERQPISAVPRRRHPPVPVTAALARARFVGDTAA
jgi:RNA polymerase sigma-B factor